MKLAFTLELGGNQGSLLEVCDGQILWTRHDIGKRQAGEKAAAPSDPQITRRDVRQILDAAEKGGRMPRTSLVAELGLGGLPGLLAAFESDMVFSDAKAETIDGRPVTTIEGTWNKQSREGLAGPPEKGKEPPPLPLFVPDLVRISFDRQTEFPRRIVYLKPLPGRKVLQPMLTVDFLKPVFNERVSDDEFQFIPPDRPSPVDITEVYLQRLLAPPAKADSPAAGAVPRNRPPRSSGGP